jgi:hypothetical protein
MVSRAGIEPNKGIDNIEVVDSANRTNRWKRSKSTVCHHSVTTESGIRSEGCSFDSCPAQRHGIALSALRKHGPPHLRSEARRRLQHRPSAHPALSTPTLRTALPPNSVHAFLGDDWNHHKSRHGISPPPAEWGVQKQPAQKNGRKVSAGIRLPRIGFHGGAPNSFGHPSLCSRQ